MWITYHEGQESKTYKKKGTREVECELTPHYNISLTKKAIQVIDPLDLNLV